MKKESGDIIILHMYTKNYDHMMYSSWDMVHDRWTDGKSDLKRWVPHLKISSVHPIHSWDKADFRVPGPKRSQPYLTMCIPKVTFSFFLDIMYKHVKNQLNSFIHSWNTPNHRVPWPKRPHPFLTTTTQNF